MANSCPPFRIVFSRNGVSAGALLCTQPHYEFAPGHTKPWIDTSQIPGALPGALSSESLLGWHGSRLSPSAYVGVLLLSPLLTGALQTASRDLAFLLERVDLPGQLVAVLLALVLAAVATPRKCYPTQTRWFFSYDSAAGLDS